MTKVAYFSVLKSPVEMNERKNQDGGRVDVKMAQQLATKLNEKLNYLTRVHAVETAP